MTDEEFYDTVVAPKLLELGKACQDRGLGFLAIAEFVKENRMFGRPVTLPAGSGLYARMVDLAMQCGEQGSFNLDKFLIAVLRDQKDMNHNSLMLHMLQRESGT